MTSNCETRMQVMPFIPLSLSLLPRGRGVLDVQPDTSRNCHSNARDYLVAQASQDVKCSRQGRRGCRRRSGDSAQLVVKVLHQACMMSSESCGLESWALTQQACLRGAQTHRVQGTERGGGGGGGGGGGVGLWQQVKPTSWMATRSMSFILSNSSMQTTPLSASTIAPASSRRSPA